MDLICSSLFAVWNKSPLIWLARIRAIVLLGCAAFTLFSVGGCATYLQPIGEWARPSDLRLSENSLKGIRVAVRCGDIEDNGSIREVNKRVCRMLAKSLQEIGAEIVDANLDFSQETVGRADLNLWYLNTGKSEGSFSIPAYYAFLFTSFIVPSISSYRTEAEIRVTDQKGALLDQTNLAIEHTQAFGWWALTTGLTQEKSAGRRQRDIEAQFLRFVQNRVYSRSLPLLAQRGKGS